MSLWWPGEWDRLISKLEDWILKRNGYNKLQTRQFSRAFQSFHQTDPERFVCTTYNFSRSDTGGRKNGRNDPRNTIHKPLSVEVTDDIGIPDRCMNSLDKMEKILKQYEHAFSKLPRRGPMPSCHIRNQQLDILNEDVIQNMFLKCYGVKKNEHEIATSTM